MSRFYSFSDLKHFLVSYSFDCINVIFIWKQICKSCGSYTYTVDDEYCMQISKDDDFDEQIELFLSQYPIYDTDSKFIHVFDNYFYYFRYDSDYTFCNICRRFLNA